MHGEVVLGPVLKDTAVAAVSDQFLGELGHLRVEHVHNHVLNGFALGIFGWVEVHGVGFDGVSGAEAVHVNMAVIIEFLLEFGKQGSVEVGWKVSKRIFDGLFVFGLRKFWGSAGGVRDGSVKRFEIWKRIERDTLLKRR